jgi:predicted 3-demethylubiquinone-9 3-methyltransferase (glyoxalase superfamily)
VKPKNTICLWYDKDALDAARFSESTLPNTRVASVDTRRREAARRG